MAAHLVRCAAVLAVVAGLVGVAAPTAYARAPLNNAQPDYWQGLSQAQRRAVMNSFRTTRGDLAAVYTKAGGTAATHYEQAASQAMRDSLNLVNRNLENGKLVNRGRWAGLARGKFIGSVASLFQRYPTAARIGTRAVPVLGGAVMLWQFGDTVGKLFASSEPQPVAITSLTWEAPEVARCAGYVGWSTQVAHVTGCPNGEPLIPIGAYKALIAHDGSGGQFPNPTRLRDCNLPGLIAPLGGVPVAGLAAVASTACGSGNYELKDVEAFELVTDEFSDGFGDLWPIDPPSQTKPADWGSNLGSAVDKNEGAIPHEALPADSVSEAAIEAVLEDPAGTALRDQIDWILGELPAEGAGIYDAETLPVLTAPDPTSTSPAAGAYDFAMPDCIGLTVPACEALLDSEGATGPRGVVVRDFDGAEVTLPAESVVQTTPMPAEVYSLDTPITITRNPDPAAMPVLVPLPGVQETYTAYLTRLQAAGLVGVSTVLTDATLDPTKGPGVVVRVEPQSGTRVLPATEVQVAVNPATAPPVTAETPTGVPGTAGCDAWVSPALDLSPLGDVPIGEVFPFSVPFWIKDAMDKWLGSPLIPAWTFSFPFAGEFTIELSLFDPHMPAIRTVLFFLSLASMVWLFASLAWGSVGGPRTERD